MYNYRRGRKKIHRVPKDSRLLQRDQRIQNKKLKPTHSEQAGKRRGGV